MNRKRIVGDLISEGNANAPFLVYKATNLVNGDFYIGVTIKGLKARAQNHWYEACSSNPGCKKFHAALKKYGKDSFSWEVIATASSFDEMMKKEEEFVAQLKPQYNICRGGYGAPGAMSGKTHSEKTKKKLAEFARKQGNFSNGGPYRHLGPDSLKKKVVCLNTGQVFNCTREAAEFFKIDRAMITEICNRYRRSSVGGGLIFRYFGEHHGGKEEARKIIDHLIYQRKHGGGRFWLREEARILAIDPDMVPKPKPPLKRDRFGAIKGHPKKVLCINDGITHASMADAGRYYEIDFGLISDVCAGRQKQTHGLSFKVV